MFGEIRAVRRARRQRLYWYDKAVERPLDSAATTRFAVLDKWLSKEHKRGSPKLGGWRDSGDVFDEGNRVVFLCDGKIWPIVAGRVNREQHYQQSRTAA